MPSVDDLLNEALTFHQSARHERAEPLLRQVLAQDPENPDALRLLALIAKEQGNNNQGIDLLQRAIIALPDEPALHQDLGDLYQQMGELTRAAEAYREALRFEPRYHPALNNLGHVRATQGRDSEAVALFEQALAVQPDYLPALVNLGKALLAQGRYEPALKRLREAEALAPDHPIVQHNLGLVFDKQEDLTAATEHYRRAAELKPDEPHTLKNLAALLSRANQWKESLGWWERAVQAAPSDPEAHFGLAMTCLAIGDYKRGWDENEWRWRLPRSDPDKRNFRQPAWDGSSVQGKTLLVYSEQGLGDTIQFSRYLARLAERGANVILECHPELAKVMLGVYGVQSVVARGERLPQFDWYVAMMSLPRLFETTPQTIPADVPYIHLDPEHVKQWAVRLEDVKGKRIGLVWSGQRGNPVYRRRACPLDQLAPLTAIEGVTLLSLQKGPGAEDLSSASFPIVDVSRGLLDFTDTAAAIVNLDLLISIDTSVAHLAGALARPVWTMLPFSTDWRWGVDRSDTPWYPTMRLYRQTTPGDWPGVIARIAADLARLAG